MLRSGQRALLIAASVFLALPVASRAQEAVPPGTGDHFKDTSPLKLPAGARVALYEFEDPSCSRAFPVVHAAVERYKIPLIRHDFPLPQHYWSRDAAITARYLQDKVSPQVAEEYRRDVFANQISIVNLDDEHAYTRKWFADHHLQMPFALGPDSLFAAEVQADYTLAERIGLIHTPTIFVLYSNFFFNVTELTEIYSKGWVQVTDVTQLYTTLDNALAQSPAPATAKTAAKGGPRKPATLQR